VENYQSDVTDRLLAEIAVKVQLSPTNYDLAVERYGTIAKFLDENSQLFDSIEGIFPQGSMAIGATISTPYRTDEEFDIDLVAKLPKNSDWKNHTPAEILDCFHKAFLSSDRYKRVVERNTRCVTLKYKNMHLDITPLVDRDNLQHGNVMHHRHEDREDDPTGKQVPSSPQLFAEWFEGCMPEELAFESYYRDLTFDAVEAVLTEKSAEIEEVPEQEKAQFKPRAKIALQLIKRFRNIQYATRKGRMPPSILLSKLVADEAPHGNSTKSLTEELIRITAALEKKLKQGKIKEFNPEDHLDELTDRWPETEDQQKMFANDLSEFHSKLSTLRTANMSDKRKTLKELFGENVGSAAVESVSDALAKNVKSGTNKILSRTSGTILVDSQKAAGTVTPKPKDFFGS
jgi:hypothetical protein